MLTKLLLTAAVIVVVGIVFKNQREPVVKRAEPARSPQDTGIKTHTVAYAIVGLIICFAAVFWFLNWRESHRIINIDVTSASGGESVRYQAYQKDIKGKNFVTLDGRSVTVGDSERIEMIAR